MRIFLISVISLFLSKTVNANDSLNTEDPFAPATMYWIGGSGLWNDISNWSKTSGGAANVPAYPNNNTIALIDANSGLTSTSTITIPAGDYEVLTLKVLNNSGFTLLMAGTNSANNVVMSVYEDLIFSSGFNLAYNIANEFSNSWKFVGAGAHNLSTGSHDLCSVEFLDASATYTQATDLTASARIRMHGGTWIADGHDVYTDYLYFQDTNGSGNPIPKQFSADVTNIYCSEWDSKFAYQSLVVTGNHTIYTNRFSGSPGSQFNNFSFNNIHLLEFPDTAPGGFSQIEYNNFDCSYCEIQNLIIEDHGRTQLAGKFTIAANLTVINMESTIMFNGGNGRDSEVTINGTVSTPVPVGCEKRTVFTGVFNDYSTIIRNNGTLTLPNAVVNDLHTSGGATFNVSNGLLQGWSVGWNEINLPSPRNYTWIGPVSGTGDWNNPSYWTEAVQGVTGCIPSLFDNVTINSSSQANIRIPHGFEAECRNFTWTNPGALTLTLNGIQNLSAKLTIAGNLSLGSNANIVSTYQYDNINFKKLGTATISTNGVLLPRISFAGVNGLWQMLDDLHCEEIYVNSGVFDTQGFDIETDYWSSSSDEPTHYEFGSSHIIVNGEMKLSDIFSDVTVNPGTSVIECEKLSSLVPVLYDVVLNNSVTQNLGNVAYSFNKLTLNGTGQVSTQNSMTLHDLVFNVNDSKLIVDNQDGLVVNGGIRSFATNAAPAVLKSNVNGTSATIDKANGNICVMGQVAFQDINAILGGVFNAPSGIDNGGNSNINFDNGSTSAALYWIGNSGDWNINSNWSRISGGCPTTKNPADAFSLVFDNNSFATSPAQVDVKTTSNCNDVYFKNLANATIDITTSLTAKNIYNNNGYVNLTGKNLFIENGGQIKVENGGVFISRLLYGYAPLIDLASGLLLVKSGAKLTCDIATIHGTFVVENTGAFITDTLDVFGTVTNSGTIEVKK